MKKYLRFFVLFSFALLISSVPVFADVSLDVSKTEEGIISVKGNPGSKNMAVQISKDGNNYNYYLRGTNVYKFPLQMGNGKYTIRLLEQASGSKYMAVETKEINVSSLTDTKVYTNSIQQVDFTPSMQSIKGLNAKAAGAPNKTDSHYNYVVTNIKYDQGKAATVNSGDGYYPVIDTVYSTNKGICYDYSALLAGILRENGIPTRLQMGYTSNIPNVYHAWNEAFIDGKWVVIDTTYDASLNEANMEFKMPKNSGEYTVVKQY